MTEYAHNHPPRCCCEIPDGHTVADFRNNTPGPQDRCPLCPEHGELAQLDNDKPPNAIPANVTCGHRNLAATSQDPCTYPPHPIGTRHSWQANEYPCCHQLAGRPHTDYCRQDAQAGNPDGWAAAINPNT